MTHLQMYRMTIKCHACGEDWMTYVSASIDLDGDEGRRIIDEACSRHSEVCPVRNGDIECPDCFGDGGEQGPDLDERGRPVRVPCGCCGGMGRVEA